MNKTVHIKNIGNITLTDKNYIGAGGEADVYRSDKHAIKLYHDPTKVISQKKIQELGGIQPSNVLKPLQPVFDIRQNTVIGYSMAFVSDTHPLCKLFTKTFRKQNAVSHQMIYSLVKAMQETTAQIHFDGCLIVDYNEMNLLVSKDFAIPYFIDVDSYQTESFPATALMESIRDHSTSYGNFSDLTDWYAFGILAFQLYIGIHPYKGKHPKYNPGEWQKRMEDGISVFDPNVKLPQVCNDFSVIPPRHKIWLEDLFVHNNRSEPPQIDDSKPIFVAPKIIVIKSTDLFDIQVVHDLGNKHINIISVYTFFGQQHYVTRDVIYRGKHKVLGDLHSGKYDKVLLCNTSVMSLVICKLKYRQLTFRDDRDQLIGSVQTTDAMYSSGKIYTMINGWLHRNAFRVMNSRIFHTIEPASQVSENAKMFDGVIYQDLLGNPHITVPLDDSCETFNIKELEKYRVLDMKLERNICVVIAEQKGTYYRFVIILDCNNRTYSVRVTDDIVYDAINFTVIKKGVCILAIENNQLEVFANNRKIKVIDNSPIDSSMKLFSSENDVFFIHEDKVMSITMK